MRRNTVRLLKYLIAAGFLLLFGPTLVRLLLGGGEKSGTQFREDPQGLPVEPQKHQAGNDQQFGNLPRNGNDDEEMVDWHDYGKITEEQKRSGPGEQGSAVILSADEEGKKNELYKVNGFNALASDKISLDRALKDIRHPQCKNKKYRKKLLTVSVVIPFHNEHWTTLLRGVHSILNRSPPELLHEIILADDHSNKDFLGQPLEDHLRTNYDGKVKVVRAHKREGLIRTRLLGAKAATGDVLIFLDSHIECNINWLPPLLDPIARDKKTVVCPFIDVIDYENFAYRAQDEGARGAFDWEFFYKRLPLLPEDLKHPADPFKSPVMAGGLFAIHKDWFWDLGGYDPGLDIWGGEQYELSFKIWQCGGMMVDAPCSRIGHIYRKFAPFPNPGVGDFVGRNYRRVAEVWMDEYAEFLYKRRSHYRNIDPGDLTAQKAIRIKHNCKPFKWFMQEVAFDLPKHYPPIEPPNIAEGEIRNLGNNMCIDTRYKNANEKFGIEKCVKDGGSGGEQKLELSWHHDIRPRKRTVCFDVSQSIVKAPLLLFQCHGMKGNQHFKYNPNTQQLYHPISNQCIDCDSDQRELYMMPCDPNSDTQKWKFETANTTLIIEEWKSQ